MGVRWLKRTEAGEKQGDNLYVLGGPGRGCDLERMQFGYGPDSCWVAKLRSGLSVTAKVRACGGFTPPKCVRMLQVFPAALFVLRLLLHFDLLARYSSVVARYGRVLKHSRIPSSSDRLRPVSAWR